MPSEIAADRIRKVSKSRLKRSLGRIDEAAAQELRQVIALLYAKEWLCIGLPKINMPCRADPV